MNRAIGIIGGMGPEASVYMYNLLIEQSIKFYRAKNNEDFPEVILYSIPVPDFISSEKNKKKALRILLNSVNKMNKLDLGSLSIACNTAHLLLPELQRFSKTSFTSMIEEVVKNVIKDKIKKVGLLASPITIKSELYQVALQKENINIILPSDSEIKLLNKIIRNIIAGKTEEYDSRQLVNIANKLIRRGAQGIILGCTELPLVFPKEFNKTVFNSVKILSLALLQKYYN